VGNTLGKRGLSGEKRRREFPDRVGVKPLSTFPDLQHLFVWSLRIKLFSHFIFLSLSSFLYLHHNQLKLNKHGKEN
jgi:hypothetical protein